MNPNTFKYACQIAEALVPNHGAGNHRLANADFNNAVIAKKRELVDKLTANDGGIKFPKYWDFAALDKIALEKGVKQRVGHAGVTGLSPDVLNKNLFSREDLNRDEISIFQDLFDQTFVKKYTRDRKGGQVPNRLVIESGFRVQNVLNYAEYYEKKQQVKTELQKIGKVNFLPAGFSGDDHHCKTNRAHLKIVNQAQARLRGQNNSSKYELDQDANEYFLFHGTSEEAAGFITKGDFLLDKAGSNAGTLYGRGIYLAESCSKSDEYAEANKDDLRCLLVCRATLGNIQYTDEEETRKPKGLDSLVKKMFGKVQPIDKSRC